MDELVTTSAAARAVGVHPGTLWRWQKEGAVSPASTTRGGQARWDVADLHRQLDKYARQREAARNDS